MQKHRHLKAAKAFALIISFTLVVGMASCSGASGQSDSAVAAPSAVASVSTSASSSSPPEPTAGQNVSQIYLYGEVHGIDAILEKELELWNAHYYDDNMRHLFIEYPYYTAEFLNIWMQSDSDEMLDAIYDDWEGTQAQVPAVKEFFKKIKNTCPETIFHGTDVGHQFYNTGERFIKYLTQNGLEDSKQYALAQEAIEQGKYYYEQEDESYRENKMVENFIREFDALDGERVMGIYGAAHTGLDAMDFFGLGPCMANQLKERYGDVVYSEDLSHLNE